MNAIISGALEGTPDADLQLLLDSGRGALAAGDLSGALEQAQRAAALASNRHDTFLLLGDVYRAQGELGQALATYRRATQLAPQLSFLHARQSEILTRQGRFGDAVNAALTALAIDQSRWENWYALGKAYVSLAPADATLVQPAQDALEQAAALAPPDNPAPASALAEFQARVAGGQAAPDPSLSPSARRAQADALLREGKAQEALTLYQSIVESDPGDTAGRMGLGSALTALGQIDDALELYLQIAEDKPAFPFSHVRRGDLLEGRGEQEAALDAFRTAAEIAPDNADVLFTLAFALRRAGLTDEAIAAFEAALAIDPDRQAARDALDALLAQP